MIEAIDWVSVAEAAYRLRGVAEAGPIGKRQSSFELYELLGNCMALAYRCAEGNDYEDLRKLVAQQPLDGNRRYVERGSDEFILVCRFVFGNLKSHKAQRSNASRYAHAMRQARARGITPKRLATHLRDHGGVNALFLARPLSAISVTTRCLYLTAPIDVPKDGEIHLSLRRMPDNRYEVLSYRSSDEVAK